MFMKKKEPRGWHPCVVLAVGGLAVVGAVIVTNHAKCLIMKMKDRIGTMLHKKCDEECSG